MMVSKVISASVVASAVVLSTGALAAQSVAKPATAKSTASAAKKQKMPAWQKAMSAGRYQDATNELGKIIAHKKTPTETKAKALLNRALAHQYLRQYKQSVSDYTEALDLKVLDERVRAIALYNRGLANRKIGRPAPAIEDFTSALFLKKNFTHAYYGRANVMRSIGRHKLALEDYRNAIKNGYPSAHLPYYGIAVTYDAMKQPAKARQALKDVLKIKPDFAPAQHRYAELAGEPYHSSTPSRAVATLLKQPKKSGSKILVEAHKPQHSASLPSAVAPPTAYLSTAKGPTRAASDDIITASIGNRTHTQGLALAGAKREVRYPGLSGSTPPVPAFKPSASEQNVTITPVAAKVDHSINTATKPAADEKIEPLAKPAKVASIAPATVSDASPPAGIWRVQINSQRSEKAAEATWKKLKKRHKSALSGETHVIQRADLGKKGIYWRVQLAFSEKSVAYKKCKSLKRRGVSCLVMKYKKTG